jgi:hypothetical protein
MKRKWINYMILRKSLINNKKNGRSKKLKVIENSKWSIYFIKEDAAPRNDLDAKMYNLQKDADRYLENINRKLQTYAREKALAAPPTVVSH